MLRPPRTSLAVRPGARVHVDAHGRTEIGGRETNQDQFLIATIEPRLHVNQSSLAIAEDDGERPLEANYIFAVADGMGGQAAGECASRLVIETITSRIVGAMQPCLAEPASHRSTLSRLTRLVEECQQVLREHVRRHPFERGLGTTLTLAYVAWPTAHIVHAGDSRAYLLRDHQVRQLTTDHTVAQQLIDSSEAHRDLSHSRWNHVLWNVIGGDGNSLRPEGIVLDLTDGDQLVLCTDGLTRGLTDDDLARILNEPSALDERVEQLVSAAGAADGRDNITVVASQFGVPGARTQRGARHRRQRTDTWPAMESLKS